MSHTTGVGRGLAAAARGGETPAPGSGGFAQNEESFRHSSFKELTALLRSPLNCSSLTQVAEAELVSRQVAAEEGGRQP